MNDSFVTELVIVAIAWLVLCIQIWLALWLVFPRLDRRPRESVRCRTCWYDVRATTADECPECGANLRESGVWVIGGPRRARVIHWSMLWFYLASITVVILANLYYHYSSQLVLFFEVEQQVLAVYDPPSGAFSQAQYTVHGEGLRWFPGEGMPEGFEPTAVTIEIYSAGVLVQAATLDTETMLLAPHPDTAYAQVCEQVWATNGQAMRYDQEVTPEFLAQFYPLGLDAETDRLVIAEMDNLLSFVPLAHEDGQVPRTDEQNRQLASSCRAHSVLTGTHEASYTALGDAFASPTFPPDWVTFVLIGLGIIAIAIGVLLIRKWCYKRDTVAWEPNAADAIP